MAQSTQPYKRSIAGSIGAGMKSIFGGEGRRFYTLVHKVSSKYHQAGEAQQIIVDQIELGRDPSCQVRFDESFGTVSRRHAAIVKDGDNWKLVQLSQTNSTYLNGHKVQNEWYLQNGDEIQLSTNGPKLGFIIPEGKKGTVGSIGLTARLNLFRQQALRPYKTAIWSLAAILVIFIGVGGYFLSETISENRRLNTIVAETTAQWDQEKQEMGKIIKELTDDKDELVDKIEKNEKELGRLRGKINEISKPTPPTPTQVDNNAINKCLPYVFYIQTLGFEIIEPSGERVVVEAGKDGMPGWSGTGFLMADGRFVTARHVAEAWYFWQDGSGVNEKLLLMNYLVNNGGRVTAYFIAISSSGQKLEFTSDQFICNRHHDQKGTDENGLVMSLACLDETDYAYIKGLGNTGLRFDSNRSKNLERGENLTVLGFPLGLGANAPDDITPIYGSGIVAAPGLQRGRILTTDTNYEQGNSGGPVFCTNKDGSLSVVGIVSAGAGRSTGFIVPICALN